jgi:hypothetical protein
MRNVKWMVVFSYVLLFMMGAAGWAKDRPDWIDLGGEALKSAMSEIDVLKTGRNLLVLTNAGYGTIDNRCDGRVLSFDWGRA